MKLKRRNRQPKPPLELSGATALVWQSDSSLIEWAQTDPNFRLALTVLINERVRTLDHLALTATESRRLGLVEGYELAIEVLKSLAKGIEPAPVLPQPTYEPEDPRGVVYG